MLKAILLLMLQQMLALPLTQLLLKLLLKARASVGGPPKTVSELNRSFVFYFHCDRPFKPFVT